MKNQIFKLFTVFLLALISCSSSDSDNNPQMSNQMFTAKVDGVAFNPDCVTGLKSTGINSILVTGSDCNTGEKIQFFFPEDKISVGTYTDINNFSAAVFIQAYYSPEGSDSADDDGTFDVGSITITDFDIDKKYISGTFSFKTKAAANSGISWDISEGSFSVTYTDI